MEPLSQGRADAVFGSRMMTSFGALKGGMPLYKYIGNRILTTVQNGLLGTRLSEFHSGYRIYSVPTLAKLPYRLNSNDFHFDTEIIIQLFNAGARIVELPIPTYYGNEICRVNGMKYAKDVLLATARNAAHRTGLLYQRRFDTTPQDNSHYDLKSGYASSHTWALDAVPERSRVIDIGAGPGGMAQQLRKKGCKVTVVDQHPPQEQTNGVEVVVQNLDDPPTFSVEGHDYLLLLDVIEHIRSPEKFLEQLRTQFTHEPKTLVLTTPNVAFCVQRLMLLIGQFNYGKAGILDRTHTRLFTFRSVRYLLQDSGFRIKELRGIPAPFPKVLGDGVLGKAAVAANLALIRVSRTLFSYQIFVVAETTPGVDYILGDSKARSQSIAPAAERHAPAGEPNVGTNGKTRRQASSTH
jgi:2-polyprenyl-3-methyl-5-hydroxy-6-metoxy-1,4-benzoquinol methylase